MVHCHILLALVLIWYQAMGVPISRCVETSLLSTFFLPRQCLYDIQMLPRGTPGHIEDTYEKTPE